MCIALDKDKRIADLQTGLSVETSRVDDEIKTSKQV